MPLPFLGQVGTVFFLGQKYTKKFPKKVFKKRLTTLPVYGIMIS